MTNFEKLVKDKEFESLIKDVGFNCAIYKRRRKTKIECEGRCSTCGVENWKWLQQEYKSLLKNGDELKTGDWIMVKDLHDDKWKKRKFLVYVDNLFWCYNDGSNCMGSGWQQARLPEEGE